MNLDKILEKTQENKLLILKNIYKMDHSIHKK